MKLITDTFCGDFPEAYWKGKDLKHFLEHEKHHGLSEKKLKEIFYLINPKAKTKDEGRQ